MRLFAPLYLSNECINNCRYCGFSRDNPILRVTLEVDEVVAEAQHLARQGFRQILLVAGEHPKFVSRDYLAECVRALAPDGVAVLNADDARVTGMARDMEPDAARMKKAAGAGYATATDLADYLVQKIGLPFREAHHITGRIVAVAEKEGVALSRLPLTTMKEIEPRLGEDVRSVLSPERSVKSRTSFGGTAPANVRREARKWLKRLEKTKPPGDRVAARARP